MRDSVSKPHEDIQFIKNCFRNDTTQQVVRYHQIPQNKFRALWAIFIALAGDYRTNKKKKKGTHVRQRSRWREFRPVLLRP